MMVSTHTVQYPIDIDIDTIKHVSNVFTFKIVLLLTNVKKIEL